MATEHILKPPKTKHNVKIFLEPPNSQPTKLELEENEDYLSDDVLYQKSDKNNPDWKICATHFKLFVLIGLWVVCCCSLTLNNVKVQEMHQISVPKESTTSYLILRKPKENKMTVILEGALLPTYYGNMSKNWMSVYLQLIVVKELPTNEQRNIKQSSISLLQNVSEVWWVPLVDEKMIGIVPEVLSKHVFRLASHKIDNTSYHLLQIQFKTNLKTNFPVSLGYNLQPIDTDNGIIFAALVLFGLYVLIVTEIVHRTLAAMLASTVSLSILAALNARPTMTEIISWIDVETLLLLFSMMTLVTILSETGIFDYVSVLTYKFTQGKIWRLINVICVITTVLSSFLDNMTTSLLLTPITIKLCEVMKLNPVPVLMYTLIFDNIGGALTPIGDPPNVIISSNKDVKAAGVNFGVFTLHMGVGILITLAVVYLQLRYIYRDPNNFKYPGPIEVQELKREIAAWKRTAASVSSYSKDEEAVKESLIKKTAQLQDLLDLTLLNTSGLSSDYQTNLEDLTKKYPIKDKVLLIKSGGTLILVICVFFLHSIPAFNKLGLGWTSLLGAILLLLLYDKENIESIFNRVEWSTLLFFASLFILMEALARLGLIDWIGKQTQAIILSVGPESRLAVAIILILWVSAIASAFVDNLPLTTMMIRIATDLSTNNELRLPLQPLIWALSFGACFGGVAEQHGYKFAFLDFMKVGFPVMILSLIVVTIYLVVCHVVFTWH